MIKKIGIVTILLICGLVISFSYAQATVIPITNAGFEGPWQPNSKFTENEPLPSWEIYSTLTGSYEAYYGVWNPRRKYDYPGTPNGAPEGRNVGYINISNQGSNGEGVMGFSQTLSDTFLVADTTYNLQVDIGNTNTNWYDGFPGYRIELLAGGVVLASDDSTLSPAEGAFLTSTVFFTAQSDHASVGDPLTIRLLNTAGQGQEVDFDNVRLDTAPIPNPEPTTILLLGAGLFGLAGFGRKKLFRK